MKELGVQGLSKGRNLLAGLGLEIVYSFVIILCSLMIYFGTKKLYELTSHKGIKYFRLGFLFFAIAYFFRSFIKFILVYFNVTRVLDLSPKFIGTSSLFLFMYFSSIAVFYLLYSVIWKKLKNESVNVFWIHIVAFTIALISILFRSPQVYFILNFILFLSVVIIFYLAHQASKTKKKKAHNLYVIYLLLAVFWILNILDILVPSALQQFQLFIYLASLGVFLTLLYKVLNKVGGI